MSTAEKLWKVHHQNQVSKLQQQLREITPPGPSLSSPTAAVERTLQEAREKWEEEQQAKIQEALDAAKQVHVYMYISLVPRPFQCRTMYIIIFESPQKLSKMPLECKLVQVYLPCN